jgi:hypothetical protein
LLNDGNEPIDGQTLVICRTVDAMIVKGCCDQTDINGLSMGIGQTENRAAAKLPLRIEIEGAFCGRANEIQI